MTHPARNAIVYNLGFTENSKFVITKLLPLICQIRQSHERVAYRQKDLTTDENILSLRLTEAFLEKSLSVQSIQIAVIGPTQAGKSSMVNRLLGENLARVSPLAGFTMHAQAFPIDKQDLSWLKDYFHGFSCFQPDRLPKDRFDCYALSQTLAQNSKLPACIVWDTPDFDSITAKDYQTSVVRTAALADVLILMVSKDKYADQSVWHMMKLLEPLAQPTLICLNKIDADSKDTLIASLTQKWHEIRADQPIGIIGFPYNEAKTIPEQIGLFDQLNQAIELSKTKQPMVRAKHLIDCHLDSWIKPILVEQNAAEDWQAIVNSAIKEALDIYQRDFLNHPVHYETFQRTLAELLTLLEMPGVAKAMFKARRVVTWPVRQLSKLGRGSKKEISQEKEALKQTVEHLYIHLAEALRVQGEKNHALKSWWQEMALILRKERNQESERCIKAIEAYHQAFKSEIEQTARGLYHHLEDHPTILNSLRATRITADAAALALALHTGGLGIQDFVIAPAILSITSMLTESVLGRYVEKAKAELKQRQIKSVERLFRQTIGDSLLKLPEKLNAEDKFNLPTNVLQDLKSLL